MCKNSAILRDVIFKHDKGFSVGTQQRRNALKNPDVWGLDRRVELLMADRSDGMYTFEDATGYDNSDFTETKTATMSVSVVKTKYYDKYRKLVAEYPRFYGATRITNVGGKIGAIRAVVYNTFTELVEFIFVPRSITLTKKKKNNGRSSNLVLTFNLETLQYCNKHIVIVKSFQALSRIHADYEHT